MNEQYVASFVKQALAAGMPQQKIAQLLDKAMEISSRGSVKTAAANHLDQIVSGLLQGAGLDKTASSVAYTNGILKEALDNGATPEQAIGLAKQALYKTTEDLTVMSKMASISQKQEHAYYAEGFIKAAMGAGMNQADATRACVGLFEKTAGGDMFKQGPQAGGPPSGGDPSDPSGGGDPSQGDPSQGGPGGPGGGDSLNNIPPQLLMQLLQMLAQQQQGGQGGPPPGMMPPGGPPGMPPGGAGGPPQGMPPGGPQ